MQPARTIADQLAAAWSGLNVSIRPGASESEVSAFELKHNVVLPEDLRQYFKVCDGMDPTEMDPQSLFRFWPLAELHRSDGTHDYFEFADQAIGAYVYAIRLSPSLVDNAVALVAEEKMNRVAPSFAAFVGDYLAGQFRIA